jgi:hypothetical protein
MGCIMSCNEQEILKEVPLDFYSIDNSYVTEGDFQIAINRLHENARGIIAPNTTEQWLAHWLTADIAYNGNRAPDADMNSPKNFLNSTSEVVNVHWDASYRIIYDANVIINRIDGPQADLSDGARQSLKAEALFFRAFAYRMLAGLFGGVPIITDELTRPKLDFERTTRQEVWTQCAEDLEAAIPHLPGPDAVTAPGRICNAAASHLLSEIYIALKQWDNAIDAASDVINSGDFALMTERFGSLKDEPGDVWWDLFRRYNQNRPAGNTEGIWVVQYEYNVEGGQTANGYYFERSIIPRYAALRDPNNVSMFIGPTTQNCGRGTGNLRPNNYAAYDIWRSDWVNDIRNSEYNIRRDLVVDNPNSAFFGMKMIENGLVNPRDTMRNWFTMLVKASTPGQHPDEIFLDKATGLLSSDARRTYRDTYAIRLAETYLLRAEAYLGKGDLINAAADINAVRNRANATPVDPGQVDINYILDERARELLFEDFRVITLSRLDLNYERMSNYDDYRIDQIEPHHNLWPIPFKEIERNTEAELIQNPGYF